MPARAMPPTSCSPHEDDANPACWPAGWLAPLPVAASIVCFVTAPPRRGGHQTRGLDGFAIARSYASPSAAVDALERAALGPDGERASSSSGPHPRRIRQLLVVVKRRASYHSMTALPPLRRAAARAVGRGRAAARAEHQRAGRPPLPAHQHEGGGRQDQRDRGGRHRRGRRARLGVVRVLRRGGGGGGDGAPSVRAHQGEEGEEDKEGGDGGDGGEGGDCRRADATTTRANRRHDSIDIHARHGRCVWSEQQT